MTRCLFSVQEACPCLVAFPLAVADALPHFLAALLANTNVSRLLVSLKLSSHAPAPLGEALGQDPWNSLSALSPSE